MKRTEKMYVITNPTPPHNNSPLVSLGKFLSVIDRAGYSAQVIGARIPEEGIPGKPESMSVRSYRYGGKGVLKMLSYGFLQLRLFFSGLCRFRRGDVVYYWIADKMIGAYLAAKLKGAENNFFLYGKISSKHGGWARKLEEYMMKNADYVCAEAEGVLAECEIPEGKKLDVIHLFVPESDIVAKPYDERKELFVTMSRLSAEKYPFETIRTVVSLHEKNPDVRLRIIGGGPAEDECRKLAHELGADDYIEFTGWLPGNEAKKLLSEGTVLLFPSAVEGVPGGILESMSFGIPALASPVGGIPNVIEDGVNGVILKEPKAEVMEEQLTELLSSGKLSEMSRAAVKTIKEGFSLDAAASDFKAVRSSHSL